MYKTPTSDNAMGAGNQQGRPDSGLANYIAGFVDGEGSFHVAVQRPEREIKMATRAGVSRLTARVQQRSVASYESDV